MSAEKENTTTNGESSNPSNRYGGSQNPNVIQKQFGDDEEETKQAVSTNRPKYDRQDQRNDDDKNNVDAERPPDLQATTSHDHSEIY